MKVHILLLIHTAKKATVPSLENQHDVSLLKEFRHVHQLL